MPSSIVRRVALLTAAVATLMLAACAGQQSALDNPFAAPEPPPPPRPAAPSINMTGRWTLASPQGGMCAMTFSGNPGASEGAIAPEGGCPGQFFTSRHWRFDQNALVILNHKSQTLARLAPSNPPGSFAGRAVSGIAVTLSR